MAARSNTAVEASLRWQLLHDLFSFTECVHNALFGGLACLHADEEPVKASLSLLSAGVCKSEFAKIRLTGRPQSEHDHAVL